MLNRAPGFFGQALIDGARARSQGRHRHGREAPDVLIAGTILGRPFV